MLPSTYQSMPKRYPFSLSLPDAVHSHKRIVVRRRRASLAARSLKFCLSTPPPSHHLTCSKRERGGGGKSIAETFEGHFIVELLIFSNC